MGKGSLKIFFGYSAGVGKTYAMLKAAHKQLENGADVIVGYIEPHDRPETAKLAEGFECVPLRIINYKGIELKEFDVDYAIMRNPDIILVDELAHTNAYGSKNAKRWLDVEELLNAGIDVWTTVNVQHIEGLIDIVSDSIDVDVKECVPDEVFDLADEVVLIDIEPTDLIERMKLGKIYSQRKAQLALNNFFKKDNLSSLRELFMRRNADRIEKQSNSSAYKTKILVLISPSPSSSKNIRVASRMSEAYHTKFSAMYVEQKGELSQESIKRLKKHQRLVKDLGGEMIVKYSDDIIQAVVDYVRIAGITDLVIGKTWNSIGSKVGFEDKLIEKLPKVQILIVPDNEHQEKKSLGIIEFFKMFLLPKSLLAKYRIANKTLDIHNIIEREVLTSKNIEQTVANILSRAFERSCIISSKKEIIKSYEKEEVDFFASPGEKIARNCCLKNNKMTGCGSDTLHAAKGVYFPIKTKTDVVCVGFSCVKEKMTLSELAIFDQIKSLLQIVL